MPLCEYETPFLSHYPPYCYTMENKSFLGSEKLAEELVSFFELVPQWRLSRGLRNLLIDYLSMRPDGQCSYMEDLLVDIQYLFELLDVAEDALKK
jgi:hypothetical protein